MRYFLNVGTGALFHFHFNTTYIAMNIWAYAAATVGLIAGLVLALNKKQYKWGGTIVSLSLVVFAASSINVGSLFSVNDAFKTDIHSLSNQLQEVKLQLAQTILVTNQINNTINNVTEIRKEVADVRSLVYEIFDRSKSIVLRPTDVDSVYVHEKTNGGKVAILRLPSIPITNSVTVIATDNSTGLSTPILPLSITSSFNLLMIQWVIGAPVADVYYSVNYVSDASPALTNLAEKIVITNRLLYLPNGETLFLK